MHPSASKWVRADIRICAAEHSLPKILYAVATGATHAIETNLKDFLQATFAALSAILLLFSRGLMAEDRQPGASANDSAPSGLVVSL